MMIAKACSNRVIGCSAAVLLVFVMLCSASSIAESRQVQTDDDDSLIRSPRGRHGVSLELRERADGSTGNRHVVIPIPVRINMDDIHAWSRVLSLSVEQQAYFESVYHAFRARDAARRDEISELWEWSASLVDEIVEAYRNPDVAAEFAAFHTACQETIDELHALEDQWLFNPLRSVLTEAQLERLTVVRNRRFRTTCLAWAATLLSAEVDLSKMVDSIVDAGVSVTDEQALRAVLDEYELSLTRYFAERATAEQEAMKRISTVSSRIRIGELSPAIGKSRKNRLRTRVARAEAAIGDLNEIYLPVVTQFIEKPFQPYFVDLYRVRAHPYVYPNAFDVRGLFLKAFAIDDLSQEERRSLRELIEVAAHEDQVVADRMIRAVNAEGFRFRAEMRGARSPLYQEKLDAMTAERRAIAENTLALLVDALSDEHAAAMAEHIEAFWARVAEFKPARLGLYFPMYPPEEPQMDLTDDLREWYLQLHRFMQIDPSQVPFHLRDE